MTVGEVFSKAFELWKKDVLWLILAALVVGLVIAVIMGLMLAIVFGVALGGVGLGYNSATNSMSGVGAGMIGLAVVAYVVGLFLIMVLGMTFHGGIFEMVIGAARKNRPARFGDVFSGFKKFGAYALFAVVMFGIVLGLTLLNIIPVIGFIVMIVVLVWIGVMWLYVLPLIADKGMTFGDAQRRSREMVGGVGFWNTLGRLILLLVAIWIVGLIIALITAGLNKASSSAGSIVGGLLLIVFEVIVGPYVVCYISAMYLDSAAPAPAAAGAYGAAPPAPPAAGAFASPPAPPAPPAAPVTPPATPAAAPADTAQTAVTEAAGDAAPDAPAVPEIPPAPPASSPPPPPPLA